MSRDRRPSTGVRRGTCNRGHTCSPAHPTAFVSAGGRVPGPAKIGWEVRTMRTLAGRYLLVRRIGVGGMSEVWHGHDRVLDRPVAVKIMAPAVEGTLGEAGVELIRTEARSAARLAHPNVAGVHDFGTSPGAGHDVPYIVMELVDGQTLSTH